MAFFNKEVLNGIFKRDFYICIPSIGVIALLYNTGKIYEG
jgi:hypothetical protein